MILLLTNAAGYHCHGQKCSADSSTSAVILSVVHDNNERSSSHYGNNDMAKDLFSDNTDGDKFSKSDSGNTHSHAFSVLTALPTLATPVYMPDKVNSRNYTLLTSGSIKPPLEPPSHS